jgi:hypothetical protein
VKDREEVPSRDRTEAQSDRVVSEAIKSVFILFYITICGLRWDGRGYPDGKGA